MIRYSKELDGAWEEPGVLGTRIEISGKKLVILWRNAPVLETTFRKENKGGSVVLKPVKTSMSYAGDARVYADVTGLEYADGKLTFTEMFPITGESRTVLRKTQNSRFGNYDIADEILDELQGTWKDDSGYHEFTVRNDTLTLDGKKKKIHVLRPKSGGSLIIADGDPSVTEWDGLTRFEYVGGCVRTRMIILDAPGPLPEIIFRKVK